VNREKIKGKVDSCTFSIAILTIIVRYSHENECVMLEIFFMKIVKKNYEGKNKIMTSMLNYKNDIFIIYF
jgi:hypothetical protein